MLPKIAWCDLVTIDYHQKDDAASQKMTLLLLNNLVISVACARIY
jgi:hypothetical protein